MAGLPLPRHRRRFPPVCHIAKNWLQHGVYGITNSGVLMPTLSRLPGYPAFLAAIFSVFGFDNFRAVLLVQVLFDLVTCFLIADIARRMFSERAAKAAFLLASICPFLANYAAAALTETLEIFFTALALDLVLLGWPQTKREGILSPLGSAAAWRSAAAFCSGPMAASCWRQSALICSGSLSEIYDPV